MFWKKTQKTPNKSLKVSRIIVTDARYNKLLSGTIFVKPDEELCSVIEKVIENFVGNRIVKFVAETELDENDYFKDRLKLSSCDELEGSMFSYSIYDNKVPEKMLFVYFVNPRFIPD